MVTFCVTMLLFAAVRNIFSIQVPLLTFDSNSSSLGSDMGNDEITEVYIGDIEEEVEFNPLDTVTPQPEELEDFPEEEKKPEQESAEDSEDTDSQPEEIKERTEPAADITPIGAKPHKVYGVHSWDDCFPDINDVQLASAKKYGIRPAKTRAEIQKYIDSHRLVRITNSPFYTVDDLTHSMPYLVPKAQQLLNTICMNFIDSLTVKGLPPHLPMITSVLRTTDDVAKLQRGNGNATTNSCHCYGTTVDITYNRFVPLTGTYDRSAELLRWDLKMKQVLAEVLNDLRLQNKCYVKYERKQACFHLTVR